ncbi:MAG: hypothetical protein K2Z81_21730 [Cyanobacteria bacterium]|nr:hypothetical protein [Cyanobacteriota bacterium]
MPITVFFGLVQPLSVMAQGVTYGIQPYYEYVLYLRANPQRDLVAEAEAIAHPMIKYHRIVNSKNIRTWSGTGIAPIAFEQRIKPIATYEVMTTSDNGESFSKIFEISPETRSSREGPALLRELSVMIGVPGELDVLGYAEATQIAATVASKLKAQAYWDEETQRRLHIDYLLHRPYEGRIRGKNPPLISLQNRPLISMSGIVEHQNFEGGWRTRGMRKLGLPDLRLEDWPPSNSPHWVISVVANLMMSGRRPDPKTGMLEVRADDPEVRRELHNNERHGGRSSLQLIAYGNDSPRFHGRSLKITFDKFSHTTLYERQTQFTIDLLKNRYVGLSDDARRELDLAIARTQSKIRGIRSKFAELKKQDARIFVAFRSDLIVKNYFEGKVDKGWTQAWDQVMAWPKDTHMTTRKWIGDPREGGQFMRYQAPIIIDGEKFEFVDSNLPDGMIEDILILHKDGRSMGGEVTDLLKKLLSPALANRPQ